VTQHTTVKTVTAYRERKCADTIGTVPVPWAGQVIVGHSPHLSKISLSPRDGARTPRQKVKHDTHFVSYTQVTT